jgi:hypothetical protein
MNVLKKSKSVFTAQRIVKTCHAWRNARIILQQLFKKHKFQKSINIKLAVKKVDKTVTLLANS